MPDEPIVQTGVIHSWIFFFSIAALFFYYRGSYRFFHNQNGYMLWLGLAILADIFMAVAASTKMLPVLLSPEGIPYNSILFLLHISMTTIGMFGFLFVYAVLLVRGVKREYSRMKYITYRVLLPIWIIGVAIVLINFVCKTFFHISIFNHI